MKWQDRAACRIADPELFFPYHESGPAADRAKAFCRACAVPVQCLSAALVRPAKGIWAGTTEAQRDGLRKELREFLETRQETA